MLSGPSGSTRGRSNHDLACPSRDVKNIDALCGKLNALSPKQFLYMCALSALVCGACAFLIIPLGWLVFP